MPYFLHQLYNVLDLGNLRVRSKRRQTKKATKKKRATTYKNLLRMIKLLKRCNRHL